MSQEPLIPAKVTLPEITLKVIILSIILAVILAISNAYLALKIGMLTSASIPAAIISMGILRFFKQSNILENNLVQTAASAGEAVAGGIVFTIPALIIINYWNYFNYWENFFIAITGSILGVFFTIPLRQFLMEQPHLNFPEGRAIAKVLQSGSNKNSGLKELLLGGIVGAMIEFAQTGLKIVASSIQIWFSSTRMLFGFGAGFSATMIGAGYLIGFNVGVSIFLGAVIGWFLSVPILSEAYSLGSITGNVTDVVMQLWNTKIRYIGIGAMLIAGLWTLVMLLKPLYFSIKDSLANKKNFYEHKLRTEKDIPLPIVLLCTLMILILAWFLFHHLFPLAAMPLSQQGRMFILIFSIFYILVMGFIFSAITGYFSGLVGVSASPGTSIVIAGLLIAALVIHLALGFHHLSNQVMRDAAAIAIILGSIITGAACLANDTMQDLKVGHIIGATPWKQQIMLLLGSIIASIVIPFVLQLLFSVYGIAEVMPRPHMDPQDTLPAPPAALMAALTRGFFHGNLPLGMIITGAVLMGIIIMITAWLKRRKVDLSILAIAIGIYLPIATTVPLFVGSLFAYLINKKMTKENREMKHALTVKQKGTLLACGLIAGSTLMDVFLAIPFAIAKSPDIFQIHFPFGHIIGEAFGFLTVLLLGLWFYRTAII